ICLTGTCLGVFAPRKRQMTQIKGSNASEPAEKRFNEDLRSVATRDEMKKEMDCDEATRLFLGRIDDLTHSGQTDLAIDHIFQHFEDCYEADNLEACDRILLQVDIERIDATLMVSFLVITLSVKDRLPSRPRFVNLVRDKLLKQRGEEQAER